MSLPRHERAIRFWDGIMADDKSVYDKAFSPDASIHLWFGPDAGQPRTLTQQIAAAATRKTGPTLYRNRRQLFGPDFMIETHTVTWDTPTAHPKMKDRTTEALVFFKIDEGREGGGGGGGGLITSMEEFLDPALVAKGPRPPPAPASPPSEILRLGGGDSEALFAARNRRIVTGMSLPSSSSVCLSQLTN
jgi:hypothetical protein